MAGVAQRELRAYTSNHVREVNVMADGMRAKDVNDVE
jgi:hypothetical protein